MEVKRIYHERAGRVTVVVTDPTTGVQLTDYTYCREQAAGIEARLVDLAKALAGSRDSD